jgi:isoquinoline 1-oxidoreductase subunit beta
MDLVPLSRTVNRFVWLVMATAASRRLRNLALAIPATKGMGMIPGAQINRRSFVVGSIAAGLALGFHIPFDAAASAVAADDAPEINAWIAIASDDTVTIRVARSEMGQGVLTALPMLVAEELECDWAKVKAESVSPTQNLQRSHVWGSMSTGNSASIRASQEALRRAGAAAREMLIGAAAAQWNCPASECRAANGVITHPASGRSARFGALVRHAALTPPPGEVALKDPKDWKIIGTPRRRLDAREKITGKAAYAIDVRLPGMLYAAIVQCPVFKGKLQSCDGGQVAKAKGVRRIVTGPDFAAVVAESWWQAKRASEALATIWNHGGNDDVSGEAISALLRQGLDAVGASPVCSLGDVDASLQRAASRLDVDYAVPFLAHATMEPQNCTAHITPEGVEIWVPTQDGDTALSIAAAAAGVIPGKVVVHNTMLGGGFGRRGSFQDFVRQAVLIAKEVDAPVQLVWSREEDMRHDFYRPAVMARLTAGLDAAGRPSAWKTRIVGQSILASVAPEMLGIGFDANLALGFADTPYAIPNYRVDGAVRSSHVPVGAWRGADYSQNVFFRECFVDEMAHAAGQDPYLFRRHLLAGNPKALRVLDAAAAKANWGATRVSHGIALHDNAGSICAQVVEASVSREGALRVHRVVSALDIGHVVNPLTVELQTQSAVVYGLTAALFGEINIKKGAAEQSNFHDYEMLRMADMPRVETIILPSEGFWGGVGELALPPLAPALCNAIFSATGKRIRSLPMKNQSLKKSPPAPVGADGVRFTNG